MCLTIHKYVLEVMDDYTVPIPSGAKFLSLQVQNGVPCAWYLVNPDNPFKHVVFNTVGTGQVCDATVGLKSFLGTYQVGKFVGHVFGEERVK